MALCSVGRRESCFGVFRRDSHRRSRRDPGFGTVASGRWEGTPWVLTAVDDASGWWRLTMSVGTRHSLGSAGYGGAGYIHPSAAKGSRAVGISFIAHRGPTLPDFVVGPVVATASEVEVTLSNGATIRTPTMAPPRGLASDIAFYVVQIPCPVWPVAVRGLDPSGRVVAHLKRPASALSREPQPHLSC